MASPTSPGSWPAPAAAAPPAPAYRPAAPPPPPPPPAPRNAALVWGVVVLFGGLLLAAAQVLYMTEFTEEMEGKAQWMLVLTVVGSLVMGLALVAAGCFTPGASLGHRVAFLGIGAFLLAQGSPLAGLAGFFGAFGGFDF